MHIFLKEKLYNLLSVIAFLIVLAGSLLLAHQCEISLTEFTWSDLLWLVLATFRLSRMIVHEKVFSIFRYLISKTLKYPLGRSLNYLITCPWCTSMWAALFIFDVFLLVPYGKVLIILLAISALAVPLLLLSEMMAKKANHGNYPE